MNSQKGNALFMILIAVVLFAALSYTVANMMRGGNPQATGEEKAGLYADEIMDYGRALRQAVQTLRISNGCAALDISFEDTLLSGYAHMPAVSDSCKVFNNAGGAVNYLVPAAELLDMDVAPASLRGQWFFPANVCVPGTGTAAAGCDSDSTDNEALIAILPYVSKAVCKRINEKLGITPANTDPPQETSNAWTAAETKFTGTQSSDESLDQNSQMAGCFEGAAASTPAAGSYHFYQVLLPR